MGLYPQDSTAFHPMADSHVTDNENFKWRQKTCAGKQESNNQLFLA